MAVDFRLTSGEKYVNGRLDGLKPINSKEGLYA